MVAELRQRPAEVVRAGPMAAAERRRELDPPRGRPAGQWRGPAPARCRDRRHPLAFAADELAARQRRLKNAGLVLRTPGGLERVVKDKDPKVILTGEPGELVLFLSGRKESAVVELDGPPEAVAVVIAAQVRALARAHAAVVERVPPFVPGLQLARSFYTELVRPALDVPHAAALIGPGSEILGFDTERSTDHHWGPRVLLFLAARRHGAPRRDLRPAREHAPADVRWLVDELRPRRRGRRPPSRRDRRRPRRPSRRDPRGGGVVPARARLRPGGRRAACRLAGDAVATVVERDRGRGVRRRPRRAPTAAPGARSGIRATCGRTSSAASGSALRKKRRSSGERARSATTSVPGWSRHASCVSSMRLCFLLERRYAPYTKWLGAAFDRLAGAGELAPHFARALTARNWPRPRGRDR